MALAFETEVLGIGTLLARSQLGVPEHQRVYSWKDAEVEELWQDILAAFKDEPEGYFLGQIVLGDDDDLEDGRDSIIDGQQRLATTSLLVAVVVQILREQGNNDCLLYTSPSPRDS